MGNDLGQAQVGTLSSTPKVCKILGDDNAMVIYKNLGNNHTFPAVWASSVVMPLGDTSVVIATGIKFHGMDLATYGNITVTPMKDIGGYCWVDANVGTNTLTLHCSGAGPAADTKVNVQIFIGSELDVSTIFCRGNSGATQSGYVI